MNRILFWMNAFSALVDFGCFFYTRDGSLLVYGFICTVAAWICAFHQ